MIQQYFQPKIGRKIRIFNLAGETTFLYKKKKECRDKTWRYVRNPSFGSVNKILWCDHYIRVSIGSTLSRQTA